MSFTDTSTNSIEALLIVSGVGFGHNIQACAPNEIFAINNVGRQFGEK